MRTKKKKKKMHMLIFSGMLSAYLFIVYLCGNLRHNVLKVQAALSWETLIPRPLRIYLLSVYITDGLCCSLKSLKCYSFLWVGGLTIRLENKPRNKLMEKQGGGTKKEKWIRKIKGTDSSISQLVTYKSAKWVKMRRELTPLQWFFLEADFVLH